MKQIALRLAASADQYFPRQSWPWTVWRETGFVISGRGSYTGQQIREFFTSEEVGPVGLLIVASLLDHINPKAAQAIAQRGIELTSGETFSRDYLPFLEQSHLAGQCFRRACEVLISAEECEVQGIQEKLAEPWAGVFAAFSLELRRDMNRPIEESISSALDEAWDSGLHLRVKQMLSDISSRSESKLVEKPSKKIRR